MSIQTLSLGHEVQHNNKTFLVVGVIDAIHLFDTGEGTWERYEEKYVQLKSMDNDIEFITITEHAEPFTAKHSAIKALPKQPWRRTK